MSDNDLQPASMHVMAIRTRPALTGAILVASDLLAICAAMWISFFIRRWFEGPVRVVHYWKLVPIPLVFVLVYGALDLYPGIFLYPTLMLGPAEELRRLTVSTTLVFLALAAATFLAQGGAVYSRAIYLMSWAQALFYVPVLRGVMRLAFARRPWWGHAAVVLGAAETARRVVEGLHRHPGLGLKVVAVLDDAGDRPEELAGVPVIGGVANGPTLAKAGIPYAILALDAFPRERHLELIEHHTQVFAHLLVVPDLFGISSLWVVAKDLGGVLGLEIREQLLLPGPMRVKRAVDLVLTVIGGVLISPFLLSIAALIKLESRGPVLFVQERLGRDGTVFKSYKFRSMCEDAEAKLAEVLASDPERRAEYELYHKMRDDPRITRVGGVLRKLSLDELPQLWNVLRGEMSLVGPRAYLPRELPKMREHHRIILRVRPGLTGLWQVSGRNHVSFDGRLNMDVYYVRNWSLWFDLYILARTFVVLLGSKGAY